MRRLSSAATRWERGRLVDAPDQKIVTLASLQRPLSASEGVADALEAESQDRFTQAWYEQVMQRLQDATDEAGGDVLITVQDREISLAQSRIAELTTASRTLPSGGQEVQFGTGLAGGDWWGWISSLRFPCSFSDPGLAELEVQAPSVPPGDGGVGWEAGLAQDG